RRARPRRVGPCSVRERPLVARVGLLHHVLGVAHRAEHPIGDREQQRSQRLRLLVGLGHGAAPTASVSACRNPSRQLLQRGRQSSSRFAFALDAPRPSVIQRTTTSPASGRASHTGTRRGGFAPTAAARCGSHSATGAGSSSTTLYRPALPRSTAATVAAAASSRWMNDHTPLPLPTIGIPRLRISSTIGSDAPGP